MTVKEFYLQQIFYDKSFIDELLMKYKGDMKLIWDKFRNNDNQFITLRPLEVHNEVLDFIDGNGFIVKEKAGSITIEKADTPMENKDVNDGGIVATYMPIGTSACGGSTISNGTFNTTSHYDTGAFISSTIAPLFTFKGQLPDDISTCEVGSIYVDKAGNMQINTEAGLLKLE